MIGNDFPLVFFYKLFCFTDVVRQELVFRCQSLIMMFGGKKLPQQNDRSDFRGGIFLFIYSNFVIYM